jgi:hypothetical protein
MKCLYFILITTVSILSDLNTQGQIAWNYNRTMQNQPVFKGTNFTGFEGNNFDNGTSSLKDTSITNDMFYGDCPGTIGYEGKECRLFAFRLFNTIITEGVKVCGPWGAWGPWAQCLAIVARVRSRKCTRTNLEQPWHRCTYSCPTMGLQFVHNDHKHGPPVLVVYNWFEHDFESGFNWWHTLSYNTELKNVIATVSSGQEFVVNYTAKKATLVVGFPFKFTADKNLPSQIESINYNMDGLDVTTGESVLMNNVGEHLVIAEINTKSGGVVKFNIPFYVIKPVTVEEITQKALDNGAIQFSAKIVNNNKVHPSAAWVSSSLLNKRGYEVDIEGPKIYNLAAGDSALINILLLPTDIRYMDPAKPEAPVSFNFIVSCPTPNGLIIDRKTVTALPDANTTPGGITGIDGPQKVRTISVKTLNGEVVDVKVPNNIRPGDHISGSIITKFQSSALQGAVVDVENKKTNVKDKIFSFIVPAGLASIPFLIKNDKGETLGMTQIPVNTPNIPQPAGNITIPASQIQMPPQHTPGSFAPMNYCQPGEPLTINGFFDGNAANTKVSINNIPCEIIAESDRGSFVFVPQNLPPGRYPLAIDEGGVRQGFLIQAVITDLSSNKTVVQKNTKATITATVSGLENLDLNNNNFKLELTNGSPEIIQFRDANSTTITRDINSSNVKNGTFTFTTDITGITTGSYTVTSNLTSTTCTDCWKKYEDCIARCEAEEKKCYQDCDKGNKGISCYLACSAAARLCEAACFAEYLDCVRKKLGY